MIAQVSAIIGPGDPNALRDCLPDLKREIARTEHHGFRHELVQREELCERLITRLEGEASRTPSVPPM